MSLVRDLLPAPVRIMLQQKLFLLQATTVHNRRRSSLTGNNTHAHTRDTRVQCVDGREDRVEYPREPAARHDPGCRGKPVESRGGKGRIIPRAREPKSEEWGEVSGKLNRSDARGSPRLSLLLWFCFFRRDAPLAESTAQCMRRHTRELLPLS